MTEFNYWHYWLEQFAYQVVWLGSFVAVPLIIYLIKGKS